MNRPAVFFALAFVACNALGVCTPDVVTWTPTPTLQWDAVAAANLAGYKVYDNVSGVLVLRATVPCESWLEDPDLLISRVYCRGVDLPYPVQRATDVQSDALNFCVKAYTTANVESVDCSNVVSVCMPQVWPGRPWPYS